MHKKIAIQQGNEGYDNLEKTRLLNLQAASLLI